MSPLRSATGSSGTSTSMSELRYEGPSRTARKSIHSRPRFNQTQASLRQPVRQGYGDGCFQLRIGHHGSTFGAVELKPQVGRFGIDPEVEGGDADTYSPHSPS